MNKKFALSLLAGLIALPLGASAAEVNLYSARKEALIKPLLDQFTEQTGIKVNLVTGKADALLKRLKSEGANSPADMLITTDAGRLHRAVDAGVLQAVSSTTLEKAVPAHLRHPEGYWYGLSVRARVITYVKGKVNAGDIKSYEDLADPKWKGKICIRSSSNIYNQSLVASKIAVDGKERAEAWATALVKNFARPPKGGDRDQVKAAAAGVCDIAVINTYYLGKMINGKNSAQKAAAAKVTLLWPNQEGRGTHVNISGAGITKASKNRAEAIQLMEFLANEKSQKWYASVNYEYPVKAGVSWSDTLNNWGKFKSDSLNLSALGSNNPAAVRIMDKAGWK